MRSSDCCSTRRRSPRGPSRTKRAPQTAFAAAAYYEKDRAGCVYEYYSSQGTAWSEKVSGGCAGYAYVRMQESSSFITPWVSDPSGAQVWPGSGQIIVWSEHKSQSNETPWHHTP